MEKVNGVDNELQIKVKSSYLERDIQGKEPRPYHLPVKGTSMDQFREMVIQFIEDKIGSGDHKMLVDKIMDVADTDKDQKVRTVIYVCSIQTDLVSDCIQWSWCCTPYIL